MKKIRIYPGVNLNIIYTDKFKTDCLTAAFAIPLCKETAQFAALLPSVLRRGTLKYPDMLSLNRRLDYLYASVLAPFVQRRGETELFGLHAEFLHDSLVPEGANLFRETLSLMSEMLFSPALREGAFISEYVDGEKKNLIDSIKSIINNKNAYAVRRLGEIMCADEPFSVCELGTEESVSAITPETLYDFYRSTVRSASLELFYTGSGDGDRVAELIKSVIPERNTSPAEIPHSTVKKPSQVGEVKSITEKMPVNQGKLAIGFRTDGSLYDGNAHIYTLLNGVFGGGVTSKLFLNVREKLSLCYYCSSSFIKEKGIINVASGINVENFEKAKAEILRQLSLTKSGEITDDEISDAKRAIANGLAEIYDDDDALESWYLTYAAAGIPAVSPSDYAELVNGVTKDAVISAANTVTLDTVYFLEGTVSADREDDEE